MRKDRRGYIVVETVSSFILFVLLITSILTLINIVSAQNRMHYALTQTAQELSMYGYVLEAVGAADYVRSIRNTAGKAKADAAKFQENFRGVMQGVSSASFGDTRDAARAAAGQVEGWMDDPQTAIGYIIAYGMDELTDALAQPIIESMFQKYIAGEDITPDAYLKSIGVVDGVKGLNFEDSVVINAKGDIELAVTYKIKFSFGILPLPFDELVITQRAKTRAWLGGNWEMY